MSYTTARLALVTCLALTGCNGDSVDDPDDTADDGDQGGSGTGTGTGTGASGTGGGAPQGDGSLGIVVIDVQEAFVGIASNADLAERIDRTKSAFELAEAHDLPFFLTFEASQQGDHALHAPLVPALPGHAQDFTKTTFDATGLPAFFAAVTQANLSHLAVLGSETDVCVLQTVLGLRAMGFTVMVESDAVFTSETNTSPALRRMEQAGALLVSLADVTGYADKSSALPAGAGATVRIVEPLELGVVLNDFTDAALAASDDPLTTQKSARLRELLIVSEWFELPVYVGDVGAGLPAAYESYFQGQLRPISQIAEDTSVAQLVFAGTDGGLADAMSAWLSSRELFVMEDALLALGTAAAQKDLLAPFFEQGLVPTTYKSFYYDMTKSVDFAEWPSQQWVDKLDPYYDLTQAPEDLPPMPPE